MSITTKAMIVKLSISQWQARKKDWIVTKAANASFSAGDKSGFYEKYIIARGELKDIERIIGESRTFHYEQTLPWGDSGERLLPSANFMDYTKEMRSKRQKFDISVAKFLYKYPVLVTLAPKELGNMWDPNDYPPLSEIKEKFSFKFEFKPIVDANDFRVNMDENEKKRIQKELTERTRAETEIAHRYLWDKLYENVSHMANQLSKTPTVDQATGKIKSTFFKDAVIENIRDMCDLLPKLNITDDKDLAQMAQEVKAKLTSDTPGQLRKDPNKKKSAAAEAKKIMKKMDAYMQNNI